MRDYGAQHPAPLQVIEAGCGREWTIDMGDLAVHLTGIDLDERALEHRRDEVGDLDEAIVADLRTFVPDAGTYDIVYSSYVLEHVQGAEGALDAWLSALVPGGLLVLRVPDGHTVFGFLARRTPFWSHVLYKKYIERDRMAGTPGHAPYPTVYDDVVSYAGMREYAAARKLEWVGAVGTNPQVSSLGRFAPLGLRVQKGLAALSFGRIAGTHANLTVVLRKPDPSVGS
jgi:SAM-dependent methyltransferase